MPLLDHYHPPLSQRRHPEGVHNFLAGEIAGMLNQKVLPPEYVAEFQIHVGANIEVDVATFEYASVDTNGSGGGTATATAPAWAPPAPLLQMPAIFPDSLEVQVFNVDGGRSLVAAIEIVSPGNKDRPDTRRAFAAKCATYLQQGIGLVTLDIVTNRRSNLHNELIELLGTGHDFEIAPDVFLYAVAYRPVRGKEVQRIDLWPTPLTIGQPLPILPLALGTRYWVPLDLEEAYMATCQRSRLC